MGWTTVCNLEMLAHQSGQTADSTSFANHADLLGSITTHSGYVRFPSEDAQLEVAVHNDSLARFAGLRVQVLVRPQQITRRYNIAEGWMSFALFIQPDGSLKGTIYDGHHWNGPDSGSTKVPAGQWSRVSFEFDGVSIAKLTLNGSVVGARVDMPVGIRQPQQVIALGHWQRADGRYTWRGDIGHLCIERRDQEDVFNDAIDTALCRRRLSPAQVDALRELAYLFSTLDPADQEAMKHCAKRKYEATAALLHDLRQLGGRETVRLRHLGDVLRAAWCCSLDATRAREALKTYFESIAGEEGAPERQRFHSFIDRYLQISHMCEPTGPPYDRMAELNRVLFPDVVDFEMHLMHLVEDV